MNGDALRNRRAHQLEAGVGDQRRAGIADQRDARARLAFSQQPRPLPGRVVVVIGGQRFGDAVDGQQLGGDAGILGGDQVARPPARPAPAGVMSRALPMGVAVT